MLTSSDHVDIKELYWFERYQITKIANLYGVSKQRISEILFQQDVTFENDRGCIFEDNEEAVNYYIDGNEENNKPQNKIKLCIVHQKKFEHRQLNKRIRDSKYQS